VLIVVYIFSGLHPELFMFKPFGHGSWIGFVIENNLEEVKD
jgi:hypothetical protein